MSNSRHGCTGYTILPIQYVTIYTYTVYRHGTHFNLYFMYIVLDRNLFHLEQMYLCK